MLVAEMVAYVRSVDSLMATCRPTGTSGEPTAAVGVVANLERIAIRADLLLEVALQTEGRVAFGEHLRVHGTMRVVAGGATVTHGVVREYEGSALLGVALHAGFVFAGEDGAAAFLGRTLVRIMAIAASDLAVEQRVGVGQAELGLFVQMALETGLRGFLRIDNIAGAAAGFLVFAARSVAGFATHVLGVGAFSLQFRMVRRAKIAGHFLMAGRALAGPDERRPRNAGWCHQRPRRSTTGNQHQRHCGTASRDPHEVV